VDQPRIEVVGSTTAREIDAILARVEGPVLQIGSRAQIVDRQENRWRALCQGREFTGVDLEAGENVDLVADICADFGALRATLGEARWGFVICSHVLEHTKKPWVAAENIKRLVRPGGHAFIAVPWVQAYHGYPSDYWRFSFRGLAELFPGMKPVRMYYSAGGTGLDAAYGVLVDGTVDLERTPFEIESRLFQLLFERDRNRALIEEQNRTHGIGRPKLVLARGYMPVTLVNLLIQKEKAV
jgi:SAM-dependent methyltransferase